MELDHCIAPFLLLSLSLFVKLEDSCMAGSQSERLPLQCHASLKGSQLLVSQSHLTALTSLFQPFQQVIHLKLGLCQQINKFHHRELLYEPLSLACPFELLILGIQLQLQHPIRGLNPSCHIQNRGQPDESEF